MFDSYAAPEAPIGGHLYWQQVGVKVILASMQQKVGISVSALCVHYVCTMYARCMHDLRRSARILCALIVGAHSRRS